MGANLVITSGFSKYVSSMMSGNPSNIYFALGTGEASWDNMDTPLTPSVDTTKLVNEVYRYKINLSEIEYVNPNDEDEVSQTPTSKIRIRVMVGNGVYYGVTREYGLFAIDADNDLNTGTLIQYCNHPRLSIPSDVNYIKYIYINT